MSVAHLRRDVIGRIFANVATPGKRKRRAKDAGGIVEVELARSTGLFVLNRGKPAQTCRACPPRHLELRFLAWREPPVESWVRHTRKTQLPEHGVHTLSSVHPAPVTENPSGQPIRIGPGQQARVVEVQPRVDWRKTISGVANSVVVSIRQRPVITVLQVERHEVECGAKRQVPVDVLEKPELIEPGVIGQLGAIQELGDEHAVAAAAERKGIKPIRGFEHRAMKSPADARVQIEIRWTGELI